MNSADWNNGLINNNINSLYETLKSLNEKLDKSIPTLEKIVDICTDWQHFSDDIKRFIGILVLIAQSIRKLTTSSITVFYIEDVESLNNKISDKVPDEISIPIDGINRLPNFTSLFCVDINCAERL